MTLAADPETAKAPPVFGPTALANPGVYLPLGLSALAWATLALLTEAGIPLALCTSGSGSIGSGLASAIAVEWFYLSPGQLVIEWLLMVAAMMAPLAAPHLVIISAQSFPDRRLPLTLAALGGYVVVWAMIGPLFIGVMILLRAASAATGAGALAPVIAFGIAVIWCFAWQRQRALRRCHAVPVLYGRDGAATRAAALYGLRLGLLCAVVCAPAMAAPMLAGQGLLPMALITHVLLQERMHLRPRPAFTAVSLALIGAMAAAL